MIIYNVTINIDNSVQDEWLRWMKDKHIPDVLKTGLFTRNTILKVLGDEDSGGHTYSIQYTCASMDDFNRYENEYAPALRTEHDKKYKDKFVAFRTMLEVIQ
ncbi:MAG: DUF4286 family protein [Bacteroidetes bacterium]|jgi:hypothetical protein|nr:DUF4286 family protein [Bacteroidota bacterium]MBK6837094.1 DUF4286 family protein [Bacteroidota bacterium]MBK9523510.1 DUF4286 family protein [Bacteroidota bacterium]MBK9541257.1 DUF4286 family protein [Bacteroidota bacterium]MBP6401123.1 DUF4286 family protein [Bacteroidia bacterium]